jgi:Mg-chelatase subunit ChlD
MRRSTLVKPIAILSFVLVSLYIFPWISMPITNTNEIHAQTLRLPADTLLPYEGTKAYTGGPHSGAICQQTDIASASGVDFAGGTFTTLAIADGTFIAKGSRLDVDSNGNDILSPGTYVLIEHADGIQSMYWHLASFSNEINALTSGDKIPRGLPIGTTGNTGQLGGPVHLHLELRAGGTAANPFGTRVSWDGQTIDGWTIWMFRWPGAPGKGISYRGSVVQGTSRTQTITNVTCGQTTADAIVSSNYPTTTTASNTLNGNTGFANFTNSTSCASDDCKALASSNRISSGSSATVDVILIIDSSGSMTQNDPSKQRLAAARAYLTASNVGDFVGVVDFDGSARLAAPLLRIPDNVNTLTNAINTIDSSGDTNIGAGVQKGCDALIASTSGNGKRAAILLTDGIQTVGSYNNQDACFKSRGWAVYTFGFGQSDDALLQRIASNTGGEFKRLPTSDLVCEFQRVRGKIAGNAPQPCSVVQVNPGATTSLLASVPANQGQATFSSSWPGSNVVMTLRSPSGRAIGPTTVAPDVIHDKGATFEVYTITNPQAGNWQVDLFGADVPPGGEPVVFGVSSLPIVCTAPAGTSVIGSGTGRWCANADGSVKGHSDAGDSLLVYDQIYTDLDVQADVSTTNREASLAFRIQDAANLYAVIFIPDGLSWRGGGDGGIWLVRRSGYGEQVLGFGHPAPFASPGQAARLRVTAVGSSIKVFFNGAQIISVQDTSYGSGKVGLRINGDSALPCDATFTNIVRKATATLTVTKAGSGSGTVTGTGINCGSTCQGQYTGGSVVTLTAVPDQGTSISTFTGWTGACSGNGTCQVTLDAAKTVTATFQRVNAGVQVGPAPGLLPNGDRILSATFTARAGCGPIQHIHFGTVGTPFDNARISISSPAGGPSGQTVGFLYTPPAGTTSVSITIQRIVQSGGATVKAIQLHDGCGEWLTFVGGGPSAFQ